MVIQFSYFQMELGVELSTGGRDHYYLLAEKNSA